ncbi:MAG: 3-hydroxybutyrate dehydrogenase, partial [Acidobacteriaceae bacterium]
MIRDRTAVITGSTSGIGLGIAEAFAAAGCRVVINGVATGEEADALVHRLQEQHRTEVFFHPANLAEPTECAALIEETERRFGTVDILVNNAGIQHVAPVEQFPPERWDAILAINLSAAFHTIRAALPSMQKRNWGRILNIASVHGLVASINKAAYVAAKHGLVGLTKVVALENAARGITCNAICPGYVLTPLVRWQIEQRAGNDGISIDEASNALLLEKQPNGRFVAIEEIAALAIFLCSSAGS